MGTVVALGLAESVAERSVGIDQALLYHLRANHYPPVPASMVGPCKRAIKAYKRGEYDHNMRLPAGVLWRGKKLAPAWAIVDVHHLTAFIE